MCRPWCRAGLRRAIGVFARGVVVQHQHLEPRTGARAGPFQHLAVAGRVAERRVGPAPDHQVNALDLAGVVVVEQELRLLGQEWIAVSCRSRISFRRRCRPPARAGCRRPSPRRRARSPGRRRSRCRSCRRCCAGSAAPPASADRQLGVGAVPARMPGRLIHFFASALNSSTVMPVSVAAKISRGPASEALPSPPGCRRARS